MCVIQFYYPRYPLTYKAQRYFLACMAKPGSNIELESPDTAECELVILPKWQFNEIQ